MQALRADGGEEFILKQAQNLCLEQGIAIKYASPYMHEESGMALANNRHDE